MLCPIAFKIFSILKSQCYQKSWVVYCQKPFAGAEGIIRYLGNYTHRVAISNHRISSFENDKVTFSYKDYNSGAMCKTLTLDASEFIRRFLQHVLPCGFYKIRYFGILALCNLGSKMGTCFNLISKAATCLYSKGSTQWKFGKLFQEKIFAIARYARLAR